MTDSEKSNTMAHQQRTSRRKIRIGEVTSNKNNQTIIVKIERMVEHPLYRKRIRKTTKIVAHDPQNTCQIGDKVKVMETRPLSKTKRWRLVDILHKAV